MAKEVDVRALDAASTTKTSITPPWRLDFRSSAPRRSARLETTSFAAEYAAAVDLHASRSSQSVSPTFRGVHTAFGVRRRGSGWRGQSPRRKPSRTARGPGLVELDLRRPPLQPRFEDVRRDTCKLRGRHRARRRAQSLMRADADEVALSTGGRGARVDTSASARVPRIIGGRWPRPAFHRRRRRRARRGLGAFVLSPRGWLVIYHAFWMA